MSVAALQASTALLTAKLEWPSNTGGPFGWENSNEAQFGGQFEFAPAKLLLE